MGLQLWSDNSFVTQHGQLNQRSKPVVCLLLPSHSALAVDGIDMLISHGLATGIRNGVFGWRNDDLCLGLSLKNLSIDGITVVSAIGHEGIKSINLIYQYVQCAGITDRFISQITGNNLMLLIDGQMQFPPGPLRFDAVFLLIPLILSVNFETGAIDDNMRASGNASSQSLKSQIDTAFRKAAVVRHGNVQVQQPDQRCQKAFGLPKRQSEHLTYHQATLDGQR